MHGEKEISPFSTIDFGMATTPGTEAATREVGRSPLEVRDWRSLDEIPTLQRIGKALFDEPTVNLEGFS
jgi:hypothetical protein